MPPSLSNGENGAEADTSPSGHRARLLQRFCRNGLAGLHEHEILELLLTYAIPRRDTKPIAKSLLKRFGSIGAVLNASQGELEQTGGIGERAATLFALCRELIGHCLRERYADGHHIAHRKDIEAYLRFHFGLRPYEFVAGVFLDSSNHVITTEILAEGTSSQCSVYPRKIIERALHHKASSFILAHNHPGGSLIPSEADWQITHRIIQAGKLLELPLQDHILISKDTVVSLRDMPRWPV